MIYTVLATTKGQITIPSKLRDEFNIDENTPLVLDSKKLGEITIKVMKVVDYNECAEYYEDAKGFGLRFKHGIDPQVLIDKIQEIDG